MMLFNVQAVSVKFYAQVYALLHVVLRLFHELFAYRKMEWNRVNIDGQIARHFIEYQCLYETRGFIL